MNWREWLARFNLRERRLIMAAAAMVALALVRLLVISPFLSYRESLRDEIAAHHEMLDNGRAYLARAADVARQRDTLRARFKELRGQLVPGDTPTLAAASLQDTLHGVAAEKGVNIQSTQVMREETVGDFRRIAVRITAAGELRQLTDFMAAVEYGPQRVALPFVELSRKGAVLRGQSQRAIAATVEVSAFLQNVANEAPDGAAAEGAPATDDEGEPAAGATPGGPAEGPGGPTPGNLGPTAKTATSPVHARPSPHGKRSKRAPLAFAPYVPDRYPTRDVVGAT